MTEANTITQYDLSMAEEISGLWLQENEEKWRAMSPNALLNGINVALSESCDAHNARKFLEATQSAIVALSYMHVIAAMSGRMYALTKNVPPQQERH